jgi:hypothetical protein
MLKFIKRCLGVSEKLQALPLHVVSVTLASSEHGLRSAYIRSTPEIDRPGRDRSNRGVGIAFGRLQISDRDSYYPFPRSQSPISHI